MGSHQLPELLRGKEIFWKGAAGVFVAPCTCVQALLFTVAANRLQAELLGDDRPQVQWPTDCVCKLGLHAWEMHQNHLGDF